MLDWIEAKDFRCLERVRLELHPLTTLLVGRNAQGKTSLLEAICLLLRLQSPRTSSRTELIRHDTRTAMLEGSWNGVRLRYGMSATQRRLAVDGSVCKRMQDYLPASGVVVWMDHSDMNLLRGGGECRRRFLDFTASQLHSEYLTALRSYERALRSRNFVLKRDAHVNWPQADAYAEVVEKCAPSASEALAKLSGGGEYLALTLTKGMGEAATLRESLLAARQQEERSRTTVCGPHRDDIAISLNGRDAGSFASEGQQRSISVAMKLSQANALHEQRGVPPILLLDDVFGELDGMRRRLLLENLPRGSQRVITTTGGDWVESWGDEKRVFQVENGLLEESK